MSDSLSSSAEEGRPQTDSPPLAAAGDEPCEVRAQHAVPLRRGEGGRVPPFVEKLLVNEKKMSRRQIIQLFFAGLAASAFGVNLMFSRNNFLQLVKAGKISYLRPPGAVSEDDLLIKCIRCNQCADVCTNDCIEFVKGSAADGTPYINPRAKGCILCMNCTNVCPTGALLPIKDEAEEILKSVKMGTAEVDENICMSFNGGVCGVCIRACPFPEVAIKAGIYEQPAVDKVKCVGCGLCENRCIVYPQAIRVIPASRKAAI